MTVILGVEVPLSYQELILLAGNQLWGNNSSLKGRNDGAPDLSLLRTGGLHQDKGNTGNCVMPSHNL